MGCVRFFEFHPDATIKEYSERFGYDTEVLKQTLKRTESYSRNKGLKKKIPEDIVLKEALLELDRVSMTDFLYSQQEMQNESSYFLQNVNQSYFLNLSQEVQVDLNRIIENYSREINPEKYNSYDLYPLEDPYSLMLQIIGLVNNGYSIPKIVEEVEKKIPDKKVVSKIVEFMNLLNILRKKKICLRCGKKINSNENDEFDFCEFCGNIFDKNSLDSIKVLPRGEFLELFNDIQLDVIK